jgi:hypothetical protein
MRRDRDRKGDKERGKREIYTARQGKSEKQEKQEKKRETVGVRENEKLVCVCVRERERERERGCLFNTL